ncbi:MAG: type III-B CRISPR module-associated protein Cmr5 [Methylococcaceae bacterium]
MQTLQQQRARYALEKVKAAVTKSTFESKAFKSQAESFPAMIRMNGLGPAAAFYLSKDGAHKRLYTILSDWLTQNHQPYEGKPLLEGITTGDSQQYRLAQAEALMLLDWIKRFAKALVTEEKSS